MKKKVLSLYLFFCAVLILFCGSSQAQNMSFERDRNRAILGTLKEDIKKNYYDPNYHGINLDERFKTADDRLKEAQNIGQMSAIIAQVMVDFNDSHLFYLPPGKANTTDYGWEVKMVGDKCFVNFVDPKSNAAEKGLEIGDQIFSIDGYNPMRENLWLMNYMYKALRPKTGVALEVIKPDGKEIVMQPMSKITPGSRVVSSSSDWTDYERKEEDDYVKSRKQYIYNKIAGLFIWHLPSFSSIQPSEANDMMDKARKSQAIILDLRGNGGGRVDTLNKLIGNFFADEIKVDDLKTRKETKPEMAKGRGKDAFTGKLIVLIDSQSASASEIFARVMQLEKRGIVIGDQSAGAVMQSRFFDHLSGIDTVAPFGISVTVGDVIMKDGKSLEKSGVVPDQKILPTAADLKNDFDPVLSKAAEMLGFQLSPADAGKIRLDEHDKK